MENCDTIDKVLAESAIKAAIYRYCAAIDRSQFHWMGEVFHADAVIGIGRHNSTVDQLILALESRGKQLECSSHMVGNILIDHCESNRAFAESYCLAIEQLKDEALGVDVDRVVRLRYADIFERRSGHWKIAHRKLIVDHAMAPVPSATTKQFGGEKGRRDNEDPAMKIRASLGLGA